MHLKKLQLLNYKNYEEVDLNFNHRVNVLVGKNGSGKTNLLDSIYYLAFTKSAFSSTDQDCLAHGQNSFMIKGCFEISGKQHEVVGSVQTGYKKIFKEDQQDYLKMSDHIGKYPVVLIAPDDVDLVREGSEARRKFFDSIISQIDKKYLDDLMIYNHMLKQRNSLLKLFQERGTSDWVALDIYDQSLVELGTWIFKRRKTFISDFLPLFKKFFTLLVGTEEEVGLTYISDLNDALFNEGLKRSRQRDLLVQRTTFGVHKDDYVFLLENGELKRIGSQGQQKSFVIALKLTQFEIINSYKGFKPILLLDDIFDKLDDFRIARMLDLIKHNFGQLFISDARPDRTSGLLKTIQMEASMFTVTKGTIAKID